jgi:hypothetical protein
MRFKIILFSVFLLIFFPIMNLYLRALRHVNMSDVKRKHQEKIVEQKIREQKEKEEFEYVTLTLEKKKYNWRKELNEQMTTADVFFTTLPATGDLTISSNDFSDPNTNLFNSYVSGSDVVMVSTENTPTIVGADYTTLRQVRTGNIDATKSSNITISINKPVGLFSSWNDRIPEGGAYEDGETFNDNIQVVMYSFSGGLESAIELSNNFSGSQIFNIPPNLRVSDLRIQVSQFGSNPLPGTPETGTPNATIRIITTQRKTPLNVFVPLDSPEATSFIRSDPNMSDLSPQERLKKLREMLDASDEYVEKILGSNFPGTGAVRPGEAGDTPGVKVSDFDVSKMEKDYGEVAGYDPMYANIKSGQVPYMKPDKARQLLSNPKYQKLWNDDPDALKIVQRLAGA